MGRAVGPILDAIGIPHVTIAQAEQAAAMVQNAGDAAFRARRAAACLLSRTMTVAG